MRTIIYYFTATGNSLYVAKRLCKNIACSEYMPMIKAINNNELTVEAEAVGFVFPLYCAGLPEIVERFIKSLNIKAKYIFAVATRGITKGCAMEQIHNILQSKGLALNFNHYITMPSNYVRMYNIRSDYKNRNIICEAEKTMMDVAKKISLREEVEVNTSILNKVVSRTWHRSWKEKVHNADEKFYSDSKCVSCTLCEKICPVGNVKMINGKPQWNHNCQDCMACVHACPEKAIQIGGATIKRRRYRNPLVTIKEIVEQK
ncbi:EFR1 family ferrodoxin [Desnuesiella massiliensis]|uniref:EFR1 family ferrodoxin n=1 Tax=Desnuesiella massiliensis TaxID=1650662 RepID=UPI0006E15B91|nr:EFR1 family ferrodoxin [Desnuesiella massiliensis]